MSFRRYFANSDASWAVLLIRLMVGWVFLTEGIQKFLFPAALGAGRFAKIGIPMSQVMGPFVGSVEVLCGALLIVGLLTRLAAIPLVGVISVAIASTKVPMYFKTGFWNTMHEGRTDLCMLLGLLFLLIVGSGAASLDRVWRK